MLFDRVQTGLVFYPSYSIDQTPADLDWDFDEVTLAAGRNVTRGWYLPTPQERKGVVLFSHGNAGNITHRLGTALIYRDLAYDIFLYDYGGYGLSTGSPSEERCYEDIRSAWDYLTEVRGIDPREIVLHGRSLGGGPTSQLAVEVKPAGVILESTFTSVPDMAKKMFPFIPTEFLVTIDFDNAARVQGISSPLLVVHGPGDSLIPFSHGQRLFELGQEPKTFLEIEGDHNEGYAQTNRTYVDGLGAFLETLVAEGEIQAVEE